MPLTASRSSRRRFLRGGIALAGLSLLSSCGTPAAPAPPVARVSRLGILTPAPWDTISEAATFWEALGSLGHVRGQNVRFEARIGQNPAMLAERAVDLVGAGVDLLVATNTAAALAARQATGDTPIVTVEAGDPVGTGLVASLARPGGNVTGLTNMSAGLSVKRLEYLKELVPAATRVAVVTRPDDPDAALGLRQMHDAAPQLGLVLLPVEASNDSNLASAFDVATGGKVDAAAAILESGVGTLQFWRFAAARRLPTIYSSRTHVVGYREGMSDLGLLAFAADRAALYRRAASYVDRILRGAAPADLPVEQPTTFQLVINLNTARSIGLTIPDSVLQQATEIVQ